MLDQFLQVMAGAATGAVCTVLVQRALRARSNGTSTVRTLRAARELADLIASVEDLFRRVGAIENDIDRLEREERNRRYPGD